MSRDFNGLGQCGTEFYHLLLLGFARGSVPLFIALPCPINSPIAPLAGRL